MSTKRLTAEERATYLIGAAVRRTLASAPRDPDMQREMTVVWRWIEHALTPDEYHHVVANTGWISEEEFEELTRPPPAKGDDDDGEVPF